MADPLTSADRPAPGVDSSALLRREAVAAFLDVGVSTLDRLDAAGLVPAAVRLGGCKAWGRRELLAWIDRGCPPRAEWAAVWPALRDRR